MKIELPRFIGFLFRRSRPLMTAMVCVGLLSGLFSAGVLAIVNRVLHRTDDLGWWLVLGFVAMVSGKLLTQIGSQLMLARFSHDTTLELSLSLCEKILKAPYRCTEQQGPAKLLVTLSDDVSMLAWSIQCLPQLAMNAAIVAGCGIYLAWLSWPTFLLVVVATLLGAWGYHWLHTRAFATIYSSREARAQLFKHFRSLTDGLKELLMHYGRRKEFLDRDVHGAADLYRRTSIEAARQYALAEGWSHLAFYSMIGVVLFVFPPLLSLPADAVIGYVVVLLYMMSPIWGIIGTFPTVERGQVAFDNIMRLGVSLDESVQPKPPAHMFEPASRRVAVTLKEVVFAYGHDHERESSFSLGPVNFEIAPGELVFVIGGNGSGKSTFVKVLTGLYVPQRGQILLSGTAVTDDNRDWYRDHYSVVFSDFYLFDKLLGLDQGELGETAQSYLARLRIDHKVRIKNGVFSTTDLSQGQRKRLALLTAYLEDRAIYVFDEWAADQDPEYKEVFYRRLLPELRERGKSIVVVTHDDRYFHLGDRVVKLDEGVIVESDMTGSSVGRQVSGRHDG
ncbi:MAG TPA: cyclic peptide export ABC transporter [Nitrospira sp.]